MTSSGWLMIALFAIILTALALPLALLPVPLLVGVVLWMDRLEIFLRL